MDLFSAGRAKNEKVKMRKSLMRCLQRGRSSRGKLLVLLVAPAPNGQMAQGRGDGKTQNSDTAQTSR